MNSISHYLDAPQNPLPRQSAKCNRNKKFHLPSNSLGHVFVLLKNKVSCFCPFIKYDLAESLN